MLYVKYFLSRYLKKIRPTLTLTDQSLRLGKQSFSLTQFSHEEITVSHILFIYFFLSFQLFNFIETDPSKRTAVLEKNGHIIFTVSDLGQSQPKQPVTLADVTQGDANKLNMYQWAHGKQEVQLDLCQSDLPRVLFEGDCSVEDELVCSAVRVHGEVADSLKLEFVKNFCSLD